LRFRSFLAGLVLAVLSFHGLARPAAAGNQVPFKGRLEAVVSRGVVDPPFIPVLLEGEGNATHLGRFIFAAPHLVNLTTRLATGSYQFKAANGDMLFATFTGQASPTASPSVVYIVEVATITGGTGRFAGATGGFTVERLYDTVAGTTRGGFDGRISSRGSAQH
jgi:hypothetical protein